MSTLTPPESSRLPEPFTAAFTQRPHVVLAELREAAPIHHVALPDGSPVWLVTRDADVRPLLADPRLSVSKRHARTRWAGFALPPELDANLLNMDGGDHLRLRRLVSHGFTPRRVAALRGAIESAAASCAGALTTDLVAEFSTPLPLTVMSDLFEVPEADRRPFAGWISTMLAPPSARAAAEALAGVHRFLLELVAERRAAPRDDLLSTLIAARDEDDRLSEEELVSLAFLLLGAGIENVQHTLSAGLLALSEEPEQLAALQAEPGLLPGAVEEFLRHGHPNLVALRRFATEPLEIAGTTVPRGDTVLLGLASANRDPRRHRDPDRFDIRRPDPAAHLALGQGVHYCLGAPLARLELTVTLSTLLPRLRPHCFTDPAWSTSFRSHALSQLRLAPGA
ncbi:cytochrome P450 [Streptomyces sp. 3MP-14]|uniref:Cytochrome P450 n=1 Tax=Streptomyces mimosae TaxID=2586635 RepID=A0A5N6A8J8_9ACTN|nr:MULTISPECIES: cytochrome P450 [Streptomyces]KAB8163798.1 cytochrome P450 [Streptomyces mimosae]KAB8175241.1 cytochrome P450 [Streptomyces sp. 3MP-14]